MTETDVVLTAADGNCLHAYHWTPSGAPGAIVQIAHGACEHAARYRRVAAALTGAGYVVVADDHRGHGRTATEFGRIGVARPGGWRAMVDDLHELTSWARREHAAHGELPVVLVGHSMGAALAAGYLTSWGAELAGCVLSGPPPLAMDHTIVDLVRQAADGDAADEPSLLFAGMFAGFNEPFAAMLPLGVEPNGYEWLSRDEEEVARYLADPLCGDGIPLTNGFLADMVVDGAALAAPECLATIPPDLPILLLAGDDDPVCGGGAGLRALGENLRGVGLRGVEVRAYEGARHELLNEVNRDEVQAELLAWLHLVVSTTAG